MKRLAAMGLLLVAVLPSIAKSFEQQKPDLELGSLSVIPVFVMVGLLILRRSVK